MIDPQLEIIEATKTRLFRHKLDRDVWPVYHYHPEYDILLFLKNTGQFVLGDYIGEIKPGTLVINGPNLPHAYHAHEPDDEDEENPAAVVLQFSIKSLTPLLQLSEMAKISAFLSSAVRGMEVSGDTRNQAAELMLALDDQTTASKLATFIALLSTLAEGPSADKKLLVSPDFSPTINSKNTERINKITAYVRERLDGKIKLDDAAKLVYMSPASFSRFFKRQTGRTFIEYVNEMRVGTACRLLLDRNRSITDVAYDSGFSSLSNFNRRFAKIKGMSPSEFRKMSGVLKNA